MKLLNNKENAMKNNIFGIISIIIAIIALGLVILPGIIGTEKETPKSESLNTVKEIGRAILSKNFRENRPKPVSISRKSSLLLGILSLIFGIISWIKKENHRIIIAAIGLSIVVLAWEYVLIAIVIAVVLIVIFEFLSLGV